MYEVRHLDTSSLNRDYDYTLNYATWAEMVQDLGYREQYANEVFMGRGADIHRDDVFIGHTRDFGGVDLFETPINRVRMSQFVTVDRS